MQNLTNLSSDKFWNGEGALSGTNEVKFGAQRTQSNGMNTSAKKDEKLRRPKRNEQGL